MVKVVETFSFRADKEIFGVVSDYRENLIGSFEKRTLLMCERYDRLAPSPVAKVKFSR